MSRERIHSTVGTEFFEQFVLRYPDKQYQTWLGGHYTRIGIDFDYDDRLLENITAGIVGHYSGLSLPSALKRAKNSKQGDLSSIPRFERIFDKLERRFHSTSLRFLREQRPENTLAEEHLGVIHAELFLLRVLSSFVAARRLINWGYFSESLTILRSSLEEIAWAYAVGVIFDKKQLASPSPSKCISIFKTRFAAAGHLYGALSRFSHMEFEAQKHFVLSNAGIMAQSIEFKFFGLLFYSFLLVAYQCVCRDLQHFYRAEHGLKFELGNVVLPIRHLTACALMQAELDRDEIAATLSEIYFDVFLCRTKSK